MNKTEITSLASELLENIWSKQQVKNLQTELEEFKIFLADASIEKIVINLSLTNKEKAKQINKILDDSPAASAALLNMIQFSLKKHIFELYNEDNFELVVDEFERQVKNCRNVKMTFALELKQKDLYEIKEKLSEKLGKDVLIDVKVKPNIVGGFILEEGANIVDASLENALEEYRRNWSKNIKQFNFS